MFTTLPKKKKRKGPFRYTEEEKEVQEVTRLKNRSEKKDKALERLQSTPQTSQRKVKSY